MATGLLWALGLLGAIVLGVIVLIFILVPLTKAIGWIFRQLFVFIGGEVSDLLRVIGAVITTIVLANLVLGNVIIGRWSAAGHFGRAISGEFRAGAASVYRILIGHPARLLCLTALTDGIERRIPEAVAAAPGADRPSAKTGRFEGYRIVGSLPGGGSGGKLYIAEPDEIRQAAFDRNGQRDVRQVVIKAFSLKDGSNLPQIVRESRALEAAKRLGLVLDHELTNERFHYVMRYVPGDSLTLVTQRLHAASGDGGLDAARLVEALGYASDLLSTLETYHRGGLWHKDVKPDNIIVDGRHAHLVDFGLLTHLSSSMTLTTHGTEYFRDPEMVRMALKGVKVHEVDGARFDVFAAGAVLYSMIENSFPAHGGLSQITRRCPEALRWIVRRSMTEYDKRYASAGQMLADIRTVVESPDPYAVKPVDLPSMRGGMRYEPVREPEELAAAERAAFGPIQSPPIGVPVGRIDSPPVQRIDSPPVGAPAYAAANAAGAAPRARVRPRLRVTSWWTGKYEVEDAGASPAAPAPNPESDRLFVAEMMMGVGNRVRSVRVGAPVSFAGRRTPQPKRDPAPRVVRPSLTAREQVEAARARAEATRQRARERLDRHRRRRHDKRDFQAGVNAGVAVAVLLFLGTVGGIAYLALAPAGRSPGTPRGVVVQPPAIFGLEDGKTVALDVGVEDVDPDREAREALANATGDRTGVQVELASATTPPLALEAPSTPGAASSEWPCILVLNDLGKPVQPQAEQLLNATLDRLAASGFEIRGETGRQQDPQADIEVLAEVRHVRGQSPLGQDSTGRALARWLGGQTDADLILWVSSFERGDPSRPDFWLVAPAFAPDQTLRLERAEALVRSAMNVLHPN